MKTKDIILELRNQNGLSQDELAELTDFLVEHMANENWSPEQVREYYERQLPKLNHWRQPRK